MSESRDPPVLSQVRLGGEVGLDEICCLGVEGFMVDVEDEEEMCLGGDLVVDEGLARRKTLDIWDGK